MIKYTYKEIKLGILRPHPIRGIGCARGQTRRRMHGNSRSRTLWDARARSFAKAPGRSGEATRSRSIPQWQSIAAALKRTGSRGKIMCRVVQVRR